jgi:hypothetical protein
VGIVSVVDEQVADGFLRGQVFSRPQEPEQGNFDLIETPYLENSAAINYYGRSAIKAPGSCYPLALFYARVADGSILVDSPSVDVDPSVFDYPYRLWVEIQPQAIRNRLLNLWRQYPPLAPPPDTTDFYIAEANRRAVGTQITNLLDLRIIPVDSGFDTVPGEPWDGGVNTIGCSWQATAATTGSYRYKYWVAQFLLLPGVFNPTAYRLRERIVDTVQGQPFTLSLPFTAVPDTLSLPTELAQNSFVPRELRTNSFRVSTNVNAAGVRNTSHLFTPQDLTYQTLGFSAQLQSEAAWADPEGPTLNTYPSAYGNYGPFGNCPGLEGHQATGIDD